MPRPKKIVQEESKISEVVEVLDAVEEVAIDPVVEETPVELEVAAPEALAVAEEVAPTTVFKVYHFGKFVKEVEENSEELNDCLEKNRVQLYDNIAKLKTPTTDQEDLVLFNVPATDNRKYNTLAQYYQQNGLAPQPPRVNDWMTYYKLRYPLATEEEIAIQVFGPLDYSFEIA